MFFFWKASVIVFFLLWMILICADPAILLHSHTVPLIQWFIRLLPSWGTRIQSSGGRGYTYIMWNRDSPISVVSLQIQKWTVTVLFSLYIMFFEKIQWLFSIFLWVMLFEKGYVIVFFFFDNGFLKRVCDCFVFLLKDAIPKGFSDWFQVWSKLSI